MNHQKKLPQTEPLSALAVHTPRLVIDSNREILVEGCRGIVAYDEDTIRFRGDSVEVRITGRGLVLNLLTSENLLLTGEISGIEYLNLSS